MHEDRQGAGAGSKTTTRPKEDLPPTIEDLTQQLKLARPNQRQEIQYDLAFAYVREGKNDIALDILETLLERNGLHDGAWLLKGSLLLERGKLDETGRDWEKARKAFEEAIRLDPDDCKVAQRGLTYLDLSEDTNEDHSRPRLLKEEIIPFTTSTNENHNLLIRFIESRQGEFAIVYIPSDYFPDSIEFIHGNTSQIFELNNQVQFGVQGPFKLFLYIEGTNGQDSRKCDVVEISFEQKNDSIILDNSFGFKLGDFQSQTGVILHRQITD